MSYNFDEHLYMVLYPSCTLVASQLDPERFAKHFTSGSSRYYQGKVIFVELDINFRNDYFKVDEGLKGLVPHEDGRPKATKYICSYRVLEHVDFDALKDLYLTTSNGSCLKLTKEPYKNEHQPDFLRIFGEVVPSRMLLLTDYDFSNFGKWKTEPTNPKGAPKVLYTQFDLNIIEFLKDFEETPLMHPPLPGLPASKLKNAIFELRTTPNKHVKGLCLDMAMGGRSYRGIRHGFMFASQDKEVYFPMLPMQEIEKHNYRFWKDM